MLEAKQLVALLVQSMSHQESSASVFALEFLRGASLVPQCSSYVRTLPLSELRAVALGLRGLGAYAVVYALLARDGPAELVSLSAEIASLPN